MKYVGIAVAVILVAIVAFATVKEVSPIGWGWWGTTQTTSGVALDGHDPVAYFDEHAAVIGRDDFTYEWGDAEWHFANRANKQAFIDNPQQYAPQFGGFCAFAVSKGVTAKPNADAWHIENGKLYVFADENVRDDWVATIGEGSLQRSEANWAKRD